MLRTLVLPLLLAVCGTAHAQGRIYKISGLNIEAPWARATPAGAKVGAGFVRVTNTGQEPDRLISGSMSLATEAEVHEMVTSGGVAKSRKLEGGLEIGPGQTVELKPGGYHLMFMDLKKPLKEGDTFKASLQFEKAGKVDVTFKVGPVGGASAPHQH